MDLIATWHAATGFASLDAHDRRSWRATSRFDGTPLAAAWQPPAFTLVTRADGHDLPVPDVVRTGTLAPVVSARAAEALGPLWGDAVEWLPLTADAGRWLSVNAVAVVAALDPDRSTVTRFESSGRVMAVTDHVFVDAPRPPVFRDAMAPELATFVDARTIAVCTAAGLTGLDARVAWPAGASIGDVPDGGAAPAPAHAPTDPVTSAAPPRVAPGSGTAVAGGYRLTDDERHTWIAPDRDQGVWYALRIPGGWRDVDPGPGQDLMLRSDGQASTVLTARVLTGAGVPTPDAAVNDVLAAPGRRLLDVSAEEVHGKPAVRVRATDEANPSRPLAIGVLAVQVGPDQLLVTTTTDDLTGAELDLVDGVALGDLVVRWLG